MYGGQFLDPAHDLIISELTEIDTAVHIVDLSLNAPCNMPLWDINKMQVLYS